ncbi:MAG TPA: caspase family protein [Variovorax sp.]|nr:caspase family protein [Variovorax sp.]
MRRLCRILLLGLLALLPAVALAQAQGRAPPDKRIALVIGNSQYPKFALSNPENDARLVAANLRKLGFEVNAQFNVSVLQFRRALREFARQVQKDDAIAVLYYAGHGVQIDGRNYLLPVDVNLRDQEEVKDESVDIDELFLSRIDKVGSYPRIVILDACRNNPFAGKTRNIRSAGGLAEMGARGTLIAFASAPGAAAEDGPDGGNSVYTKSLAEEMLTPGIEVEQMFKNVRVKVLRETKGRQLPWVNTSLTSDFSFSPAASRPLVAAAPAAAAPAAASPSAAAERESRPKDIETALESARRDSVGSPVARPPQSPPPPAPVPAATPAPAPAPPAATQQAAIQPSPSLGATPPATAPAGARQSLGRDELQQLLAGKSHSFDDAGVLMRWDLRSGGLIYYNARSTGRDGVNGSGRWEIRDDGNLCVRFNTPSLSQPSNTRRPDSGCWQFFREGDKLLRGGSAAGQPPIEIVNLR